MKGSPNSTQPTHVAHDSVVCHRPARSSASVVPSQGLPVGNLSSCPLIYIYEQVSEEILEIEGDWIRNLSSYDQSIDT